MIYFWVGIAGTFGAVLRYLIGISLFTNCSFPYATLIINLIGSFLLSWLTTHLFKRFSISPVIATTIGTGFVGSFTTFSTLSVETVKMFQAGKIFLAVLYIVVSIFGGLIMSWLGVHINKEVEES